MNGMREWVHVLVSGSVQLEPACQAPPHEPLRVRRRCRGPLGNGEEESVECEMWVSGVSSMSGTGPEIGMFPTTVAQHVRGLVEGLITMDLVLWHGNQTCILRTTSFTIVLPGGLVVYGSIEGPPKLERCFLPLLPAKLPPKYPANGLSSMA